jgi:hypothetical protein
VYVSAGTLGAPLQNGDPSSCTDNYIYYAWECGFVPLTVTPTQTPSAGLTLLRFSGSNGYPAQPACASGQIIIDVDYVFYGNPGGSPSAPVVGSCDAATALAVFQSVCEGFNFCIVNVSDAILGAPTQVNGVACNLGSSAYVCVLR